MSERSLRLLQPEADVPGQQGQPAAPRPVSATAAGTAATGLVAAIAAMVVLRAAAWTLSAKVVVVVLATAAAMMAVDAIWFRRLEAGALSPVPVNALSANRLVRKGVGLAVTLGAVTAAYFVFTEYQGSFYAPVWQAWWLCLPWLAIATPIYVVYVDRRQADPEDAYAQLGGLLTAQSVPADWTALGQHARGWLVKGFFLPLMFVYLTQDLGSFWKTDFAAVVSGFGAFYNFSYSSLFLIDLLFAVVGYATTLRLTGTHIRSTDGTMLGWVVCLLCYQPFWSVFETGYFTYEGDNYYWGDVTAGQPVLFAAWGTAIIACLVVYALSTVSFGLRFSNLTHRGIITIGPYRWTKHPAYISKCVSFWLISVPFLSNAGPKAAVTQSLMLLGSNAIYLARAMTEERHLAHDPVYRAYQAHIRQHGLFARLRRFLPAVGGKAPPLSPVGS